MRLKANGLWSLALLMGLTGGLSAQSPSAARPAPVPEPQRPTFSVQIDLVTTDVIARDKGGNFIADLTKNDFEVYEDGVKQDIVSMTLSHGGRVTNVLAPPPPPATEGIIVPVARPAADVSSGRIFVFYIDDLHMQFGNTLRVRELFKKISKTLLHEGDLFAIVSSGTSSISVELTYDRKRLDESIKKITGSELKPSEIINGPSGADGPTEVRYRAHVALSTVTDLLGNLEKVHNRRKTLVYVSDGYDFTPFQASRLGLNDPTSPFLQNSTAQAMNQATGQGSTNGNGVPSGSAQQNEEFADADLAMELAEITRTANRANTTIYTIDPRGLVSGPDIDEPVDTTQWMDFISKSQSTLRTLADETGGIAMINQNSFDKMITRIDAETSDYYVLGYYSTNPLPSKRFRKLDVRVTRPDVSLSSRKEYMVKGPAPTSSTKQNPVAGPNPAPKP
jgi:VWFA-related protein